MRVSHLLVLLSSIALFAWTRPAPLQPQGPRGLLELRLDLLSLNFLKPGSSQMEVKERLGRPDSLERLPDHAQIWTYRGETSVTTVYLQGGKVVGLSEFGQGASLSGYELICRGQVNTLFGPPQRETPDTYSYSAGAREITFLFGGDRLRKTTLCTKP